MSISAMKTTTIFRLHLPHPGLLVRNQRARKPRGPKRLDKAKPSRACRARKAKRLAALNASQPDDAKVSRASGPPGRGLSHGPNNGGPNNRVLISHHAASARVASDLGGMKHAAMSCAPSLAGKNFVATNRGVRIHVAKIHVAKIHVAKNPAGRVALSSARNPPPWNVNDLRRSQSRELLRPNLPLRNPPASQSQRSSRPRPPMPRCRPSPAWG